MAAAVAVFGTVLLVAVSQAPLPPPQTPPPQPTALILGRVVDAGTNRPVPGAIVALDNVSLVMPGTPRPTSQPRAMTNASGQFVFRKLPKGLFNLTVTKNGYAEGAYGRRRPGGTSVPLDLDEGQRTGDVVIPIWRHGSIGGTVVDEAGEPLMGVQVRAFQRRNVAGRRRVVPGQTATTDDRGIYRLASIAPGDYLVAFVWREASLPAATAELRRNPSNDPKSAEILREQMSIGTTFLMPGTSSAIQVGGLVREMPFGSATPPPVGEGAPISIYPTQFYPGVSSAARAAVVTIASGQERESIDFALHPVRTARVSGTVVGPEGPMANVALRLVPATDDALTELETSVTMTGSGGEFTLLGVPAGQYKIKVLRIPRPPVAAAPSTTTMTQIQVGSSMIMTSGSSGTPSVVPPPIPDDPTMFAETAVSAGDRDVNDVIVTLQRGARVSGRFEFDGALERPNATALMRVPVMLERADAAPPSGVFNSTPAGRADESGVFKTYGVAPGKYIVRVGGAPPGWTLKSVTSEGRDLSETPIDLRTTDVANVVVTFTDRPTKLSGTVRGRDGNTDRDALVIVFPTDPTAWSDYGLNPRRIRSARPSKNGSYTFTGLPAGDYYVAAIHEDAVQQWQDPQILEDLARGAVQVRLSDGDSRTQDVKTAIGGGQ